MHNILPVLTVLAGRRVPVDVFCPLCRHHPESLDHLMKDCEIVAPLWQTILTDNIPGIGEGGIAWLCDILTRGEAVLKLRIIATWWSIWRARNELVWNGKPWQLNTVVNEIQRSMETWQNLGNITGATHVPLHAWQDLLGIPAEDLYEKNLNNLGHVNEILGLKGRTTLFKISAKKEHYVRRNIPFPVVKIKTDQLLLQQLCPDLLALDENEFNSDGPSSEGDDKFLEGYGFVELEYRVYSRSKYCFLPQVAD
nr:uncharacterized protein LOC109176397 [Ipomoea trifida]